MTNPQELQAVPVGNRSDNAMTPAQAARDGGILALAILIAYMKEVPNRKARIWSIEVQNAVEPTPTINPIVNVTKSLYRKGYLMKQLSDGGKMVLSSMGEEFLKRVHWSEFEKYISEDDCHGTI